ncbi:uncharacterized protein LOC144653094 [Oculina patagonica]
MYILNHHCKLLLKRREDPGNEEGLLYQNGNNEKQEKCKSIRHVFLYHWKSTSKELTNILVLSRCRLLGQCFRAGIAERINLEKLGVQLVHKSLRLEKKCKSIWHALILLS